MLPLIGKTRCDAFKKTATFRAPTHEKRLMSTSFDQTAILIFSRTARHEAVVKVFDRKAGKSKNRAIAHSLIRQTLATANRTRLPVFLYSTAAQSADTFGENFADAPGYRRRRLPHRDAPRRL